MSPLLEGFLGALVGGGFALAGSWIVAKRTFDAVQMTEQRILLTETRARLARLYAPVIDLAWALELIVQQQRKQTRGESRQARLQRHNQLLREKNQAMKGIAAALAMERQATELEKLLAELSRSFDKHVQRLNDMGREQYSEDEQEAAIEQVGTLATKIQGEVKATIAGLDTQAERLVRATCITRDMEDG